MHTGPITLDVKNELCNTWIHAAQSRKPHRVNTVETFSIPARTKSIMRVSGKTGSAMFTYDFKPTFNAIRGVYVSKTRVQPDVNGQFFLSVINTIDRDVLIHNRTRVGELQPCSEVLHIVAPESRTTIAKIQLGTNLSSSQKGDVHTLLQKYSHVSARDPKKPEITPIVEHSIDTGESKPTYSKPRRLPNSWNEEVNEHITEMLKNGIIRPSKSPYNCPIILVRKRGKARFVCDYRDLNRETKRDTYPLPNIKDYIEIMEGAKFWFTLDAVSAYWSVKIKQYDREKPHFPSLGESSSSM